MSKLVAVSGATGFLGRRLVALLISEGYRVRALHRRGKTPVELLALACESLEIVRADLGNPSEMQERLKNVQVVIHAAALARDWGSKREFRNANVEATRTIAQAAMAAGCEQLIFVSSLSVQGFGFHDGSTEEGPYYPLSDPYPASKKEAESIVLSCLRPGFSACVLRLGYVFGPGDTTSTYRMFDAASRGSFGWIGKGENHTSMVYVDDACRALASAVGNPDTRGEIINIVGDEVVSWKDFARLVYEALGLKSSPRRLPKPIAFFVAIVLSAFATVSGNREGPALTLYRIRRSAVEYVFSNAKAKRILGFKPEVGIEKGLEAAAAAYLDETASSQG